MADSVNWGVLSVGVLIIRAHTNLGSIFWPLIVGHSHVNVVKPRWSIKKLRGFLCQNLLFRNSRLQKVGIRTWDGLGWSSFFLLSWDQRIVIFHLTGFY